MKSRLMMIGSALIASLICLPAMAQPGPGMGGGPGMQQGGPGMQQGAPAMGQKGPGARGPRDCAQTANPEACTAHRDARAKAAEACKAKVGPDRKQCMIEQGQNFDCSKSANPQQCEARKLVLQGMPEPARTCFPSVRTAENANTGLQQGGRPEALRASPEGSRSLQGQDRS